MIDNRGVGESDEPEGPYTVPQMAADVAAVLDDAGIERTNLFGVSLGGFIAQEFALAYPRARRQARPLLDDAGRAEVASDARARARGVRQVPDDGARGGPAADGRELARRARRARRARASSTRSTRTGSSARRPLAAWQAQAYAGATFDAYDRIGAIAVPTLVLHGGADNVVDPRNARAARRADPERARRDRSRPRPPDGLGGARSASRSSSRSSCCRDRPAASATARARRRTASRSTTAVARHATRELDAGAGRVRVLVRRSGPAARRPRRDAHRQLARARSGAVRLRAARPDPAAALVAPRAAGARSTSSTTPSRRSSSSRTSTPSSRVRPGTASNVSHGATSRCQAPGRGRRGRRPAAPDLHVGNDGQAEGRAADARELLLDEPRLRSRHRRARRRRRAAGAAAVPRRRVERAGAARLVEGRARRFSSGSSTRRARCG